MSDVKRVEVPLPNLPATFTRTLREGQSICQTCGGLGFVFEPTPHICGDCIGGVQQICPHCGRPVRSLWDHCCSDWFNALAERTRIEQAKVFAKAEKISIDEARRRGIKLLCRHRDHTVFPLDEAEQNIEQTDETPSGFYPAKMYDKLHLDAYSIVEDACSDLHEEALGRISDDAIGELQALLDQWVSGISGTESYGHDYSVFVMVPQEGATDK